VPAGPSISKKLAALEKQLQDAQASINKLDLVKAEATALGPQIQALKDLLKAQQTTTDGYRDFYNNTQKQVRQDASYVETVRCQLTIRNAQCVKDVIAAGHKRVAEALAARDAQRATVEKAEAKHARATFELEHATRIYTFFKTGLQAQVKTQLGDLAKLRGLADPKKDHCEAEFYLTEMEWHLRSEHSGPDTSQECYEPDLRVATFLDCWPPPHYATGFDRAAVTYNDAVIAEKKAKAELDQTKGVLKTKEDALTQAKDTRVAWTLAELKAKGCCKPMDTGAAAV
jgi:hypothetical protein